ncbi:MAG: ankyrin repeat domain-containing protein [Caulobacteraceae bacterium]
MKPVWFAGAALALALGSQALAAPAPPAPSLLDAAQSGDRATVLKEIARKVDVNQAAPDDGSTALLWAAHNDDAELVKALLAAGANVKAANAFGDTPMREAATNGNVEILKTLLDAGADVESTSPEGQTSLMIVSRTANLDAAKLLLDRGANVNAVEKYEQQSALMWASEQNQPAMVRLLISKGANVNAVSRVHVNDVRVTAEPRVKYDPSGGLTPLMIAAREGCLDCAKALVEAGAKVNAYDPDSVAPLFYSIWNAHFDLAAYMIKAGADVNKWDFWGRTPLWGAVDYNTIPTGGRSDRPSDDDTTSLDVIKQLLAAGANPNARLKFFPPYRAIGNDRGGDLIFTTGATPLLRAARGGDVEVVDLLLKAGAKVDLPVERAWKDQVGGITPLMSATGLKNQPNDTRGKFKTEAQSVAVIKLLVAAGADVNARDDRGDTALHGAVLRGYNDVVTTLIKDGADPYRANNDGKSAADIAKAPAYQARGQIIEVSPKTAALIAELKPPPAAGQKAAAPAPKPTASQKVAANR